MFETENFSYAGKQKNKNQAVKTLTVMNNNDISEQQCCSNLYSRVMPIKCCCKWLDNNEIFRASFKKSIYKILKLFSKIFTVVTRFCEFASASVKLVYRINVKCRFYIKNRDRIE